MAGRPRRRARRNSSSLLVKSDRWENLTGYRDGKSFFQVHFNGGPIKSSESRGDASILLSAPELTEEFRITTTDAPSVHGSSSGFSIPVFVRQLPAFSRQFHDYYGIDPKLEALLHDLGYYQDLHYGERRKDVTLPRRLSPSEIERWKHVGGPGGPSFREANDVLSELLALFDTEVRSVQAALQERISQAVAAAEGGEKVIPSRYTVVLTYKGHVLELAPVDTQGEAIAAMQQMQEDIRIKVVEGSTSKGARANRGRARRNRHRR